MNTGLNTSNSSKKLGLRIAELFIVLALFLRLFSNTLLLRHFLFTSLLLLRYVSLTMLLVTRVK